MKNEDESFEIYLSDLSRNTQRRLLKFLGVKKPQDLNLDVFVLCKVPKAEGK